MLDSMMNYLPDEAWKEHKRKHEGISLRKQIISEGSFGKKIELKEADSIRKFTPTLWYLVSSDSGKIMGIDNTCVVVGYNTPLGGIYNNLRCLAIFERVNSVYKLKLQSFRALEEFADDDNDNLFDRLDETNFSTKIENGRIVVNYSYMRGESTFTYGIRDGEWVLFNYSSVHRTCCAGESYSYDYETQKYSCSISSVGEYVPGKDTSYTIYQKRPIIYMDSMNVSKFDYDETGILAK